MKTKNIFKTVALAMLMPAMLLTSACSNQDDIANTSNITSKGYALPVTVSATRGGDATRATFDGSKLNFSTGDKLFVYGSATAAGSFAGELTWQSGGTFSGTIYTQKEWTGTPDALFTAASAGENLTATLLPNGYDASSNSFLSINNNSTTDIAYDDRLTVSGSYAFVASETAKATGVEQLSLEQASTYSSAFALSPGNAILNFTITGLEAGAKDVLLHIHHGFDYDVFGSVTPNASGVATFAVGVPVGANIKEMSNNLTVGTHNFTLPSSTTFAAGKIYNITRSATPEFSVSDTKKVTFSSGNLQATWDGTSWNWHFAENQWDYIGNAAGNTSINGNGTVSASNVTVDLFGWVGASNTTWSGDLGTTGNAAMHGITSSTATNNTNGYGNNASETLKSDWGNTIGSGWRTLTGGSGGEWEYLFNTRTVNGGTGNGYSYTLGQSVNDVLGVVLYPDDYIGEVYTTAQSANWSDFEAAGCVFLPAAGYRYQAKVGYDGSEGYYWSSSPNKTDGAYNVSFFWNSLDPAATGFSSRYYGYSVRLVRDVE